MQLTAAEIAALTALDPDLDLAFTGGLTDSTGKLLVPALPGYQAAANVKGATPTDQRPVVRQSYMIALIPLLRAATPPWIEIGSAGAPAFQNGWVNFGSGEETAAFSINAFNECFMKGLVKSGTVGSPIFTLPFGLAGIRRFAIISNSAAGQLVIDTSGNVFASTPTVPGSSVSLNISFKV